MNMQNVDLKEWKELLSLADDLEPQTRMLLYQYTMFLDSQGRSFTKPNVLAKTLNMPEKEVRRHLQSALDARWLEAIQHEGKKGFRVLNPLS